MVNDPFPARPARRRRAGCRRQPRTASARAKQGYPRNAARRDR